MSKKSKNIKNVESVENKEKSSKIKEIIKFYKSSILRKHIIVYILLLIIFFVSISVLMDGVKVEESGILGVSTKAVESPNILKVIFSEKLPLVALIVFSGITPFVYIPLLGAVEPYILAKHLVQNYYGFSNGNVIISSIGAVIQLFGIAMAIGVGIYFCSLSSKRFRYNQNRDSVFSDFRVSFYKATSKNKKAKELEKKIKNKKEKNEKLNVKVPYINIIALGIISFVIVLIGTIISKGV